MGYVDEPAQVIELGYVIKLSHLVEIGHFDATVQPPSMQYINRDWSRQDMYFSLFSAPEDIIIHYPVLKLSLT
jgi:hypothetical protein